MYVYGLPPIKIESSIDNILAEKTMLEVIQKYGDREILVVNKKDEVTGSINASLLLSIHSDKGLYYMRKPVLKYVKTVHKNSLTWEEIQEITKRNRSLLITTKETKQKRFRRKKTYWRNIESEITVNLALEGIVNEKSGPRLHPGLIQYNLDELTNQS